MRCWRYGSYYKVKENCLRMVHCVNNNETSSSCICWRFWGSRVFYTWYEWYNGRKKQNRAAFHFTEGRRYLVLVEKIQLWSEHEAVRLYAYLQSNDGEYSADKIRPAVIICPGGGYVLPSDREAEPVAMKFAAEGYQTFVLRYSTYFSGCAIDFTQPAIGNEKVAYPGPLYDLAKALIIIRENSSRWFIDSNKIVLCGFSAGGHLAASLGVHWNDETHDED